MCYLYFSCLQCYLINIHIFDYPDSRLSGLFTEVPTSPDNRGSTVQKMWRVFDQPIGMFVYFFVRIRILRCITIKKLLRADPSCRSVIKEFVHALSCIYIEL